MTLRGRGTGVDAAQGLCAGCPTAEIAAGVAARVGGGTVETRVQAIVFSATR